MKDFITPAYTFSPGASGVGYVDLHGIDNFDVKRLVAIINQTQGVLIYSTGAVATKFTAVTGTQVTLNFNTTSHSASDRLQVIYSPVEGSKVYDSDTQELIKLMSRMVKQMDSLAVVDSAQRQRVTIDAGTLPTVTSVGTVSTVSTVSNITSVAGMNQEQYLNIARNTYANGIRSKLSF